MEIMVQAEIKHPSYPTPERVKEEVIEEHRRIYLIKCNLQCLVTAHLY